MPAISLGQPFYFKLTTRYIGVNGGYLGDFTRSSLRSFYLGHCDLDIKPDEFEGTTRERFIDILAGASPKAQAKILRGVLERFPVGQSDAPESRTPELQKQIESVIGELREEASLDLSFPTYNVQIVRQAISDAEALLKANGPTSAVDRIHTALHGFLLRVCRDSGICLPSDPTLPALFKSLRGHHPAFQAAGPRSQDIVQIMRAAASILDVMNPLRNHASMAHPNENLLGTEEALLVINISRSILNYLDTKLPASRTD